MTALVLAGALASVTSLGCVAVLLVPRRALPAAGAAATTAVGATGVLCGLAALRGGVEPARVGWLVPLAGTDLAADATSGLFMVVTGAVGVAVGIYTADYAAHGHASRTPLAVQPLFVAAMLGVPLADSVTTFLLLWELMALASLALVLAEPRRAAARDAGVVYAAMTHLGFLAVLTGLVLFAAAAGGGQDFGALRAAAADLPPGTKTAVYLLTVAGFGSKAGLVPLHAWLPRAHPEAPSPASALMSAAMVNLGVYGIVRVDLGLLGPGPRWWGLALLAVGAVTAVYSVLQASVATDLKRLLAYSTSENMGLICVALGTAAMLRASGSPAVAATALTAALVHLVCHAAFKSLAFLAAGAVATATGLRDLDALGGLAPRMPTTTVAFGVAALGAAGLPLGCGFVGEWLLLQSLVQAVPDGGAVVALVLPLAVGAVALTTGLGVVVMVKAFGVGFLARPRSAEAEQATEVGPAAAVGMGLAALACAVLAVAPAVLAPALSRVLAELPVWVGDSARPELAAVLRLPGTGSTASPALLAVAVAVGLLIAFTATQWRAGQRPPARSAPLWACGGTAPTPRMQYTATSFAEPLQRVFDGVLRPDVEVAVSHHTQAPYLLKTVSYRSRVRDSIESALYAPVLRAVAEAARLVRRAHAGSIHAYLGFGAVGLLVALLAALLVAQ